MSLVYDCMSKASDLRQLAFLEVFSLLQKSLRLLAFLSNAKGFS